MEEYAIFPLEQLIKTTQDLRKRLGHQRMMEAVNYLQNKNFEQWAIMMLEYYDKFYQYGMEQRKKEEIYTLEFLKMNYADIALQITNGSASLTTGLAELRMKKQFINLAI